jgi:acyl-CoA thioester hydrolase
MSSPDRLEPSFYRHWIEDRVRFADLDPLGHCNNAAIGGFFESSRIALFADAGHPVSGGALSIPIVRVEIDFRHEILYRSLTAIAARQLPKSSPSCSI